MKAILDANGNPAVTAERVKMEKMSRFNPLSSLTPAVLSRQLVAYQRGDIKDLAWTMDWMEKHEDILGPAANKAKSAVARYGYDVLIRDEVDESDKSLAEAQQAVLQKFYQSLEVRHAVEKEERGGMRLLLRQVMDGYGKGYAMHHIVWNPDATNGLTAEVKFIPLWFFENREGDMRFLENPWTWSGKPIESEEMGGRGAWMVSCGRGVMLASAIAWMFKHIPLQDWLTYCARHGMPAFLGKTAAEFESKGWNAMADAVAGLSAEWGGVINQSDAIEILNLTSQGEIPYEKLVDRMDRAFTILWRGGDLSTISRGGGAVGSNPQENDGDELDGDNAMWAGETIDSQLGRRVIDYHFGEDVPQLAYLKIRTATRDDVEKDLKVVETGVRMGMEISKNFFSQKFALPLADDGDELLRIGKAQDKKTGNAPEEVDTPDGTTSNSTDQQSLLMNSLSKVLGVRPGMLSPIAPLMYQIMDASGELDDEAFFAFVEDAALSMPELFNPEFSEDLAEELEAAMGTAALTGIRDSLRQTTQA